MRTIVSQPPMPTPPAMPTATPAVTEQSNPIRPRVDAPGQNRPISDFAVAVGEILAETNDWYVRNDRPVVLREVPVADPVPGTCLGSSTTVFHYPSANECRSLIERWVEIGATHRSGNLEVFVAQSMGKDTTTALLDSPQFKKCLPPIRRILDVPVPILVDDQLTMVTPGYNRGLHAYCRTEVDRVEALPLEESKALIHELLNGFPFANDLSRCLAIARLLTPFCKGLMGWSVRTPLWVFEANRPRAGKDYLAGCCGILYEGRANEDAPLDRDSNETRKRITAALLSGRRFMHFANTAGDIHNDAFEQAVTAKTLSNRLLGSNDAASDLTMDNELEFSVSGNTGFTFSEDFALRCRRISLAFFEPDANGRRFPKADLHGWIRQNRARILGALAGLIWEWDRQGRPEGPTPFTSFPEWARVVGGIMVACELGDPCAAQRDGTFTKDPVTEDMTTLYQLAASVGGSKWMSKADVRALISESSENNRHHDLELFPQWDLQQRAGQTAFGLALQRYQGRDLGGIRMEVDATDKRRVRYRFVSINGGPTGVNPSNNRPGMSTLSTLSTSSSGEEGGVRDTPPLSAGETGTQRLQGRHLDRVDSLAAGIASLSEAQPDGGPTGPPRLPTFGSPADSSNRSGNLCPSPIPDPARN